MDFFLFILLNAVLFIRPAEVVPELLGLPIYEVTILLCTAAAGMRVLSQLRPRDLVSHPISLCVVALVAAVFLSYASQPGKFPLSYATDAAYTFLKILLYYLLFVAIVNTPGRIRAFLFWLTLYILALVLIAVLFFFDLLYVPTIVKLEQAVNTPNGLEIITRLQSTGIFSDPNDLAVILAAGLILCFYWVTDPRSGIVRFVWLAAIAFLGWALSLTVSRGGLIAAGAGVAAFLAARYGWRKAVFPVALLMPVALLFFAGRQSNVDLTDKEDTAQERILLWSEGMMMLRQHPLFGIGVEQFQEEAGLVAHNSFVHAYTEMGLFGGTLFLAAYYLPLFALARMGPRRTTILNPEMRRLRPYLFAIVACVAAGMLSLSRNYVPTTYTIVALAAAYLRVARCAPPLPPLRFDGRMVRRLVLVSAASLLGIHLFIRTFAVYG